MAFTTEIEGPNERTTTAEEAFTTKARALVTIEVKTLFFLKQVATPVITSRGVRYA